MERILRCDIWKTELSSSSSTSARAKRKSTGEKKEITDWHDIVVWRGLAEVAEKYLKKGYKVYIEGKIKKRSWQDKENITRYTTEIIADELNILSRPEGGDKTTSLNAPYKEEGTPPPLLKMDHLEQEETDILPF